LKTGTDKITTSKGLPLTCQDDRILGQEHAKRWHEFSHRLTQPTTII